MPFSRLDLVFCPIYNYNIRQQAERKAFRIPQRKVTTLTVIKLKTDGEFYRQLVVKHKSQMEALVPFEDKTL